MLRRSVASSVSGTLRGVSVSVSCSVSIVLALCLVVAGPLSQASAPGAGTRDRDRVARLTRSGSSRFDSPEAILHSHEETKPDVESSSLVVGEQYPSVTADSVAADPPHAVAVADTHSLGALLGPGAAAAVRLATSPTPGASPPSARPPGRAPPVTA